MQIVREPCRVLSKNHVNENGILQASGMGEVASRAGLLPNERIKMLRKRG